MSSKSLAKCWCLLCTSTQLVRSILSPLPTSLTCFASTVYNVGFARFGAGTHAFGASKRPGAARKSGALHLLGWVCRAALDSARAARSRTFAQDHWLKNSKGKHPFRYSKG
jgi:hypothetical protein